MPVEGTQHKTGAGGVGSETWIPLVIPGLKTRWADFVADLPANQPIPKLSDWLALLHIATTAPVKIPRYLYRLLNVPRSDADRQRGWTTLTKLFDLTFEVVQTRAGQLDARVWQSLVDIQNRILTSTANIFSVTESQPASADIARRALYLQTVAELNKKIVVIWDPNELLDEVVNLIQRNFGYEYVNLFLLNQAKQTLILQSAGWKNRRPKPEEFIHLKVRDQGAVPRAALTGQSVLVNDVSEKVDLLPQPALSNIKAELSVPLLADNNLLGVLDIASDRVNAFSKDDRQILLALADHIAVAIESARLQRALQRYIREQTLLYESNLVLGTSLDVDTVLQLMTQKTVEAMETGACVICRLDDKADTVAALAEHVSRFAGNPPHTWRKLNVPVPISEDPVGQQILKTGRPVVNWANSRKPTGWQQPQGTAGNSGEWGIVLALPLKAKERMIGLMEIYDQNPSRDFSAEDIQLCQILAMQTALAIERAQLFDETRQRLSEVSMLYTMAQEIAGNLDLQGVLDTIVVSLRQVMDCRGCCIFLVDPSGENLEIKAADGLKPRWRQMARLRIGEGAAGMAVAKGQTIYLADTRKEAGFIYFDEEVRSLMVAPLSAQGEIIGAINIDDSRVDAFGPAQEQLLTIAAAQAGVAIQNARLFAKVSAERQQTQAIIQYMADGVLLIDGQGVIVACNPTLVMMLGLNSGRIVGQRVNAPNLHPNLASITAPITRRARTGVLAKEVNIKTPRPRTLQIFSTPVVDDDQHPIGEVRVIHDVTRERELEQLKDDFMSTISHELRTPLFSIQGFAQILLEDEAELEKETREEFLSIIQTQAIQLSEMVNNLLDLSKFDEGKMELEQEPVAVLELIRQTILKLQGFAHQQKIQLVPQLPPGLPTIVGDSQRLGQVLTNLIGNAIKFSEAGSQVTIAASVPGNELLVEVEDNGIGIPPEALEHIFSRYYQVDNNGERSARGSGLGLHIAKKIVEGHGGRIWAESTVGQGSIFRFTLPLPNTTGVDRR